MIADAARSCLRLATPCACRSWPAARWRPAFSAGWAAGPRWPRWPAPRWRRRWSRPTAAARPSSTWKAGSSGGSWSATAATWRRAQALIELDDTAARSEHAALLAQWQALIAAEARLWPSRRAPPPCVFPSGLAAAAGQDPALARVLSSEADRLTSRRTALADQQAVLAERVAQGEAEIQGLEAEIGSGQRQLELIAEEVEGVRALLAKGLERKPRLLALQRAQAQIAGSVASSRAGIARARQVIAETRQQMRSLGSEQAEQIAEELAETRKSLAPVEDRLRATADRLGRTMIAAPVGGTVVGLQVKTAGRRGRARASRCSRSCRRVPSCCWRRAWPRSTSTRCTRACRPRSTCWPTRAEPCRGSRARCARFPPTGSRIRPPTSPTTWPASRSRPEALPAGVALSAGMPADVAIVTAERTLLDYLVRPLTDTLRRGLRES